MLGCSKLAEVRDRKTRKRLQDHLSYRSGGTEVAPPASRATRQLILDRTSCRAGNPSEQSDVIAELQDKRVVVTNGDIDADAGEILWIGWVR
jgi:hypothetical protein